MTLVSDINGVHPRLSPTPLTLSNGGNDGFLATLGVGADQFTMSWVSSLPVPVLDGSRARYVDAIAGGIDLVVEAHTGGFDVHYEIPQATSRAARAATAASVARPRRHAHRRRQLELRDGRSHELVAEAAPAIMWGAARTRPAAIRPMRHRSTYN